MIPSSSMTCKHPAIAAGLVALILAVGVCGCGDGNSTTSPSSTPGPLPAPSPTPQSSETSTLISCEGFEAQPSYLGTRQPDSEVILRFSDGYLWLITDAVEGWETHSCSDSGLAVETARGFRARYHHVLFTQLVKTVPR
jgi:hypothetical protein